jgi:hypothetical protein
MVVYCLLPGKAGTSFEWLTHVPYKDKHLVYASYVDTNESAGTLAFGLFSGWTDMASVDQSRSQDGVVSPTLFFFQPKGTRIPGQEDRRPYIVQALSGSNEHNPLV